MKNIEVEARSFIDKKQLKALKSFFNEKGRFIKEDFDETVYFKAKKDLRIRRDGKFSYLILKEGRIHDKYRKETEIKLPRADFSKLESLITSLGFKVDIRWYRRKRKYVWQGINTYLWSTKGYGNMIELEQFATEKEKKQVHEKLTRMLKSLGVPLTPKKELEKKFAYYKKNWKQLTQGSKSLIF